MMIVVLIGKLIIWGLEIYSYIVLVRIILSWVPVQEPNALTDWIERVTDPPLDICRRYLPPIMGLDLSPILLFFIIYGLQNLVRNIVIFLAYG